MCLNKIHKYPIKINKPLEVYKIFQESPINPYLYQTSIQHYIYEFYKLYKQSFWWKFITIFSTEINKGFHSYNSLNATKGHTGFNSVVIQCIIPKGSYIYYGTDNEITSNKIIITGIQL